MPNVIDAIRKPAERFRAAIARGLAADETGAVDPEGGDYKAGIIRGCAVITVGEALGHGLWIDAEFLSQVTAATNAEEKGVKARFTHPGLSSDGMGKFLGRLKNARIDGEVVRGDLHLSPLSRKSPDGDLGGYVMGLAVEDPAAFGESIVFDRDWDAEEQFEADHTVDGQFVSPDKRNVNHYCHCRLSKLYDVDTVDEPAANPNGMFHRGQDVPQAAEKLLSYCLGLSEDRPGESVLNVDPDRLGAYLQRFLARHGIELTKEGDKLPLTNPLKKRLNAGAEQVPEEQAEDETAPPATKPDQDETAAEGDPEAEADGEQAPVPGNENPEDECPEQPALSKAQKFMKAFGREQGAIYFAEGKSFAQAHAAFAKEQQKQNEQLAKENEDLKAKLSKASGVESPVPSGGDGDGKPSRYAGKLPGKLSAFADSIKLPQQGK